jgi:signal transduction histidine kinase
MRQWGLRAYLFFGAALAVAYYLVPPAFAKLVVWPVIGFSSAAVIVVGIRRNRPDRPLAWYLFAIGQVLFALGDTLYAVRVRVLHDPSTVFPSYIDFLYLAFYPCLAAGLWLLIRRRTPGRDTASLIDATIVSTGLALLAWVFLIVPYVRNPELRTLQRVVAVAYPLADVLVLAMAARLAVGSGQRPRAWAIMMASLAALIAGDVVFGLLQLNGTWQQGGPIDLTWIAFYVGWGVAALHPSMADLSRPAPVSVRLPRGRLVLITCASLMAPAVLVIQSVRSEPLDVPVIAGGSAVLFLLALARMSGLAGEVALQQERKRAVQSVLRVTEAERSRLAAELHDGPVQQLTALLYGLELARHHVRRDSAVAAGQLLASLEEKATGEINELRRLMTQLRPPVLDELGLVSALRNQGRTFESASGVRCAIDTESELRLAPELETVLYRVTQESLTNVSKHANASKVNISLAAVDGHVRLLIRDDGVGFNPLEATALEAQGHFGLTNMRERVEMVGGTLLVDSSPGRGTTIAVEMGRRIPFP